MTPYLSIHLEEFVLLLVRIIPPSLPPSHFFTPPDLFSAISGGGGGSVCRVVGCGCLDITLQVPLSLSVNGVYSDRRRDVPW